MKLPSVAALLLAASVSAQQHGQTQAFPDPANLRGERVNPHTGRELPIDEGARGLEQTLRRLNTRASLMLIVAHPDDEDGGLLTLYSRGLGARVADLSLTRGEGGQNAMTGDFEDALGLIRTQELLSADRYMGADQLFGTEVDFGFSKTKEEAFTKWTHERVLYDAVRAVRLYRPLVIAAVFLGGVTDGHGQHQVSGEIAQEVFKAAADPKVFPELTREGILPWQPLKVYARVPMQAITAQGLFDYATGQYAPARFTNYVTGEVTTTAPSVDVTVHEGQIDPLLSGPGEPTRSYVQFARLGLGLQKTQIGPGVRLAAPGVFDIGYHRYGSRLPQQPAHEQSFFDGVDASLNGIAGLSSEPPVALVEELHTLSAQITQAQKAFDPKHPAALGPQLAEAQNGLSATLYALEEANFPDKADVLHELRVKQVQLNEALTQALGLHLDASLAADGADLPAGTTPIVQTRLESGSPEPVGLFSEHIEGSDGQRAERLLAIDREPTFASGSPFVQRLETTPELTKTITRPYFFRTSIEQPIYQLSDAAFRNAAEVSPALTAWATLRYHGVEVSLGRVVNVGGQPVSIVPPASVSMPTHAQALPHDQTSALVTLQVTPPGTRVEADLPPGWQVHPDSEARESPSGFKQLQLIPPKTDRSAFTLQAVALLPGNHKVREGYRPVGYEGLPHTNFFTPATDRIVPLELTLPKRRRIGYLPGTGDAVPAALATIGLPVTRLTVADLTPAHLAQLDTVILGVRTYNAHPDLHGAPTEALFAFARNGGNVLVQYQTPEFTAVDAPYPLSLGNAEKVVDETAPVRLLESTAAPFRSPNHITPMDFNGWVEERGHGFLASWDPRYTALTEVHDPGQQPQQGGLVTTQLGRGHWTYCAFALYRQLPEAVPGAFRMLVNLLGLADEGQ